MALEGPRAQGRVLLRTELSGILAGLGVNTDTRTGRGGNGRWSPSGTSGTSFSRHFFSGLWFPPHPLRFFPEFPSRGDGLILFPFLPAIRSCGLMNPENLIVPALEIFSKSHFPLSRKK